MKQKTDKCQTLFKNSLQCGFLYWKGCFKCFWVQECFGISPTCVYPVNILANLFFSLYNLQERTLFKVVATIFLFACLTSYSKVGIAQTGSHFCLFTEIQNQCVHRLWFRLCLLHCGAKTENKGSKSSFCQGRQTCLKTTNTSVSVACSNVLAGFGWELQKHMCA